jgi:hypothetical protein
MRGIRRRLKNRFEKYGKSTKKKHCGNCVERAVTQSAPARKMKAVSAARLKEVLEHGKAKSSDTQPAARLGVRATKAA